jgi:hypothetical protein
LAINGVNVSLSSNSASVKSGNARPEAPLSLALDVLDSTFHMSFSTPAEYLAIKIGTISSFVTTNSKTVGFTIQSYDNGVPSFWGQARVVFGLSPRVIHSTYLTHHFWSLQFIYSIPQGAGSVSSIAVSVPEDGPSGTLFVRPNCKPSTQMGTGDILTNEYCLFAPDQSPYQYIALDGPLKGTILGNCIKDGDICQSKTPGQYGSALGSRLFPTNYAFRTTANTGTCFFMLLVMHILKLIKRIIGLRIQIHRLISIGLQILKLPEFRTKPLSSPQSINLRIMTSLFRLEPVFNKQKIW